MKSRIPRVVMLQRAALPVLFGLCAFSCRAQLVYHPRSYDRDVQRLLPPGAVEIPFQTRSGSQTAFYLPAQDDPAKPPGKLWVLFGGNGSLALDWCSFVGKIRSHDAAFLLVEYPGYGKCQGRPSSRSILESTEGSVDALARYLNVSPETFRQRMSLMGHSLGAAAALQYAAIRPVKRVILIAPFTSLDDMARLVVGPAFSWLLLEKYDNMRRMREIAEQTPGPRVLVIHGTADSIIPVTMGRKLAAAFPQFTKYHEIKGADHGSVIWSGKGLIRQVIAAPLPAEKVAEADSLSAPRAAPAH